MKPISIYNALGIVEMASLPEARYALRRLLRLCYKKTRDNLGTTEESLRFYNQASQILNDNKRRDLYDQEWALTRATPNDRIDHVLNKAVEGKRQPLDPANAVLPGVVDISPRNEVEDRKPLELLPTNFKNFVHNATLAPTLKMIFQAPSVTVIANNADDEARSRPATDKQTVPRPPTTENEKPNRIQTYHPVLTENVALAKTPIAQGLTTGLVLFMLFALLYVSWNPVTELFNLRQSWIWVPLLAIAFMIAVVGFQRPATRIRDNFHLMTIPNEEAVKGWRRRGTIFMGSNQFTEDPSWVFQLRMAELERGRLRRTTLIAPWQRAAARLFDYALWGWFLIFPLHELARLEIISAQTLSLIENPLIAPILITLTWVPVEALLTAAVGTTLGKWLFGIYVQFHVSDPFASRSSDACWRYAFNRAFRVWWQGAGMGIPPVMAFTCARAVATLLRYEETEWDSDLDAFLTSLPMKLQIQTLGLIGLMALSFLYIAAWQGQVFTLLRLPGGIVSIVNNNTGQRVSEQRPVAPAAAPALSDQEQQRRDAYRSEIIAASEESKMLLELREWNRALASCERWAQLEITNPEPLRCQGIALQKLKRHIEAINAFRRAKFYAPEDRSLDEAIQVSQTAIFRQMSK